MSDYWVKEAERRGDENALFGEWIERNEDFIIESFQNNGLIFPESIYEGVLDDDYEAAENIYCESMTIEDVNEDFIQNMYNE